MVPSVATRIVKPIRGTVDVRINSDLFPRQYFTILLAGKGNDALLKCLLQINEISGFEVPATVAAVAPLR